MNNIILTTFDLMGKEIYAFTLFCLFVTVFIILTRVLKGSVRPKFRRLFISLTVLLMCTMMAEAGWIICEGRNSEFTTPLIYICNIVYYVLLAIISIIWFYHSEKIQNSKICKNKLLVLLVCLPLIAVSILVITTPENDLLFSVVNNEFELGKIYYLYPIVIFSYTLVTAVKAWILSLKKENLTNKADYQSLAKFMIFPILGAIVKCMFPLLPAISFGLTIATAVLFIDNIQQLVSIDPLTQVNNRSNLFKYLTTNMHKNHDDKELYIIMIDANEFKQINDAYGHLEGDYALIAISKVLNRITSSYNGFLSRYGGDEFLIALRIDKNKDIKSIYVEINEAITKENVIRNRDYNISLSIGFAKYNDDITNVAEFIRLADESLYEDKAIYRKSKKKR